MTNTAMAPQGTVHCLPVEFDSQILMFYSGRESVPMTRDLRPVIRSILALEILTNLISVSSFITMVFPMLKVRFGFL